MTGEELKEARNAVGITQKQLGLLLGYSEASAERTVQRWEYGSTIPAKQYRKLAEILKVSIDRFIP